MGTEQVVELNYCIGYSADLLINLLLLFGCGLFAAHPAGTLIWTETLAIMLDRHLDPCLIGVLTIVLFIVVGGIILISYHIDYKLWGCKSHSTHVNIIQTCCAWLSFSIGKWMI